MAIDGVIGFVQAVVRDGATACDLFLVERPDHGAPPRGQETLTILDPTWTPAPGATIWGGSDTVEIRSGGEVRRYRRVGYTRLREMGARAATGEGA